MASPVEICNLALGNIGITQTIENINDPNERARACKLHYAITRDWILRKARPNFAMAYVPLALVSDQTIPGWQYAYRYPSDCLFAEAVTTEGGDRIPVTPYDFADRHLSAYATGDIPFRIFADGTGTGRLIVCDFDEAYLRYVRRIEDTEHYDPEFVKALAWQLAAEIAIPLKVNAQVAKYASDRAMLVMGEAQSGNMTEQVEMDTRVSPSVKGRE